MPTTAAATGAFLHENGSAPVDTGTSVILGRASSGARELATRVLAERYPCSAIALTLFDPPAFGQGYWATRFYGAPTTRTAHLIAEGAREERIADSILALSSVPFDPERAMHVTITLRSRPLSAGIAVSTIRCEGLDALTGIPLQRLEPVINFTWMTHSAQLFSISRED